MSNQKNTTPREDIVTVEIVHESELDHQKENGKKGTRHKREWHQGTIQKQPNGRYRVWVFLEHGKRVSATFDTPTECNRWASRVQSNPALALEKKGTQAPSSSQSKTQPNPVQQKSLGQWMEEWIPKAESQVRPSTLRDYKRYAREMIIPELGEIILTQLKRKRVNAFYEFLAKEGYRTPTIRYVHRVLHRALEVAYEEEEILTNPAHKANVPVKEETEMMFFTEQQVWIFLSAVRGHPREALYDLAVKAGPRESELLGLKWQDIDFLRGTMTFQRQIRRVDREGLCFAPLKTKSSRRTICLGTATLDLLRRHKINQDAWKKKVGTYWQENDLVFPTTIGTPLDQSNLVAEFKAILEIAGLPEIRFHDLRHTAASIMLKLLKDVIVVSRTLGHSRPSTTLNIYGHLLPGIQAEAAQMIDDALTPTLIVGFPATEIGQAMLTEEEKGMSLTWARKKPKNRQYKKVSNEI